MSSVPLEMPAKWLCVGGSHILWSWCDAHLSSSGKTSMIVVLC